MADVDKNITRFIQDTEPDQPNEGDLWWDGGSVSIYLGNGVWVEPNVEKVYSADSYNVIDIFGGWEHAHLHEGNTFIEEFSMSDDTIRFNGVEFNRGNVGVEISSWGRSNAYVAGGISLDLTTEYSTIDRWSFSDKSFTIGSNTMDKSYRSTGTLATLNNAYILGGYALNSSISSITKISDETWVGQINNLSATSYGVAGLKSTGCGYHVSGANAANTLSEKFGKLDYYNDTAMINENLITTRRDYAIGLYSTKSGYIVGGTSITNDSTYGNGFYFSSIEKLDYATDTTTSLVGNLIAPMIIRAPSANSTYCGYVFGGGVENGGNTDEIQKFIFSADMSTASIVNNLLSARLYGGAVSSADNNGLIY